MFRALLWKEWRELWMLPAAAAPLAAMSFFITKGEWQSTMPVYPGSDVLVPTGVEPVVWDAAFALWLLLAAIYIPTHLYARETDLRISEFLGMRPLDRFRLWWLKLSVGITALAGVGLTVATVIMMLQLFYTTSPEFYQYGAHMISASVYVALILFSLSSFFSSLFRKQLSALVSMVLVVLFIERMFWFFMKANKSIPFVDFYPDYRYNSLFTLFGHFTFPRDPEYLSILFLIFCPIFLFSSLAIFAKGNMAKQARGRIALTYSLLAIVTLSPVSLGVSRFSGKAKFVDSMWSGRCRVEDVSPDGTRILLSVQQTKVLHEPLPRGSRPLPGRHTCNSVVLLDLQNKSVRTIETERPFFSLELRPRFPDTDSGGNKVLLYELHRGKWFRIFPDRLILADLDGNLKKNIFTGRRLSYRAGQQAYGKWSLDGNYIAVVETRPGDWKEGKNISTVDSSGNRIGKYTVPVSEKGTLYVHGWDYKSRFYFNTITEGLSLTIATSRIRPDNMVPEKLPNIPFDNYFIRNLSPDGRWLVFGKNVDPKGGTREYWLYDIAQETYRPIGKNIWYCGWSPDSRIFAYTISTEPLPDMESKEEAPSKPRAWFSEIILYEIETGTHRRISTEPLPNLSVRGWSISGKHLLFSRLGYVKSDTDKAILKVSDSMEFNVLSVESGEIAKVVEPFPYNPTKGMRLHWISGDRLMWPDGLKIVATDYDGSLPEEIFRVEDGKFYLYGEEQS